MKNKMESLRMDMITKNVKMDVTTKNVEINKTIFVETYTREEWL
jgi:hypothetical protein